MSSAAVVIGALRVQSLSTVVPAKTEGWKGDNERLCEIYLIYGLKMEAVIESEAARSAGQRLT